MMARGATTKKAGHNGRLRSCSIESNTIIANGKMITQSSSPPMRYAVWMASGVARKAMGIYHIWLSAMDAKKIPVHRRSRGGVLILGAKALPLRNSR